MAAYNNANKAAALTPLLSLDQTENVPCPMFCPTFKNTMWLKVNQSKKTQN